MVDPGFDDDALLDELRRLAARMDPVPDEVTAAAKATFTWRTVDDELAELLHDSAEAAEPAGVRGPADARVLVFGAGDAQVELEVSYGAGARELMGQLTPPVATAVAIRHSAGETVVEADDRGRFTASGVPGGAIQLRFSVGARTVSTRWLAV